MQLQSSPSFIRISAIYTRMSELGEMNFHVMFHDGFVPVCFLTQHALPHCQPTTIIVNLFHVQGNHLIQLYKRLTLENWSKLLVHACIFSHESDSRITIVCSSDRLSVINQNPKTA